MSAEPTQQTVPPPAVCAPRQNAPWANTALVCGIIGLALPCVGVVLGILALVAQKKASDMIARYPERYGGTGYCTTGLVTGILGVIFGAMWWTACFVIAAIALMSRAHCHHGVWMH